MERVWCAFCGRLYIHRDGILKICSSCKRGIIGGALKTVLVDMDTLPISELDKPHFITIEEVKGNG